MNLRVALAGLLFAVTTSAFAATEIRGAWTATTADENSGTMHVQLSRKHNNSGQTMRITDFAGLSEAQINAASQTPVAFALRREAGTVAFEGVFKAGFGAGQFTFTPNPGYFDTVRSMGVSTEPTSERRPRRRERNEEEMLLACAVHDLSTSFIRSMMAEGYRVSLDEYFAMRIHRVTPETIRELRALGFDKISYDDLIAAHIHRVTPQYIREMRAAGFTTLDLDELVASRIHRVEPEVLDEYRALGYTNLTHNQLMQMSIHRVTPEYIRELKAAGYSNIPVEKLVAMRIHRVDPEFIRKMNAQ